MDIRFTLNGREYQLACEAGENVQGLLKKLGMHSVRNSDDGFGFAGSDAIWFDGVIVNASLLIAAQIDGKTIKTAEALGSWNQLNIVQQAMVDVGVIQSGYNDPAVALILTNLLERDNVPSREDIDDALSGMFCREAGYQQFYQAVELASIRLRDPDYRPEVAPSFRDDLSVVGKVSPKLDAVKSIQAKPSFVEDFIPSDTCVLKMLRSPHAHAWIKSIDVSAAEALPGVVYVITHQNCPDLAYTPGGQSAPEPSPLDRRMFCQKLRHVGDRVAAVVAESEAIALAAFDLIKVEYEVLKPVMSIEDAMAENAPIIHNQPIEYRAGAPKDLAEQNENTDPRAGKYVLNFPIGAEPRKNIAARVSGHIGDTDVGFSQADKVIERTYRSTQIQHCPNEPHICYTHMDGDRVIVHASTQVPWHIRRHISNILGLKQNKVRVIKERVGGGFGSKQDMVLEEVCAFATYQTGRPVYFRYTREEEFIASSTRHVAKVKVKIGAKKDGTITAIAMDFRALTGPYGNHALTVPCNGPALSLPLYPCDNVHFDVTTYYANICPAGAFQGYGAPKGNFALTMAIAELARELGIDQLEMIEKNRVHEGDTLKILGAIGEGKMPTFAPTAASCALDPIMAKGREMLDWGNKEQPENSDWSIGQGVSIIQQKSGIPDIDQANCWIKLASDGSLIVHPGGADIGTGLDTVVAKLTSEVLCCPLGEITVLSGDTDHAVFDKGAYASSGTCFSGNAAKLAAEALKQKILNCAAEMLNEPVEQLRIEAPCRVQGEQSSVTFAQIAQKSETGTGWGQLMAQGTFITPEFAFPYGANFAEVAVNKRTGEIKLKKFFALLDCGTPINPDQALGQIYGASMRAIGHSLYEELKYDEQGIPLTRNLKTYGAPKIGDLPEDFRAVLIPSDDKVGPYGAKSISEIAVNGAAPAIATAIQDAAGVWVREWNFTPEKILKEMNRF